MGMPETQNLLEWLKPHQGIHYVLVYLNVGLLPRIDSFKKLWNRASYTAVVDGAINTIHKLTKEADWSKRPNLITGDFDSANTDLLSYYTEEGTEVIHTPCQNSTDFTKCLKIVGEKITKGEIKADIIVAIDSFNGRLDHMMSNINSLYLARDFTHVPLYLYSGDSVAYLLSQGHHHLYVDPTLRGDYVGLIPIGCPARDVTTTGLRFNLDHGSLQFGGMVSSSNAYTSSDHITIDTDQPLLWTTTIQSPGKLNNDDCKL